MFAVLMYMYYDIFATDHTATGVLTRMHKFLYSSHNLLPSSSLRFGKSLTYHTVEDRSRVATFHELYFQILSKTIQSIYEEKEYLQLVPLLLRDSHGGEDEIMVY